MADDRLTLPPREGSSGGRAPIVSDPTVDYVQKALQQNLADIEGGKNAGFFEGIFGGANARAYNARQQMPELLKLQQQAIQERRAQETERANRQKEYMQAAKEARTIIADFHNEPPDTQKALRPFIERHLIRATSGIIDPEDVRTALEVKDYAGDALSQLTDPFYTDTERERTSSLMGRIKPGDYEGRAKVVAEAKRAAGERASVLVRSVLPEFVKQMGGTPEKPVELPVVAKALRERFPQLAQSQVLQQAILALSPEEQAGMGIRPGKVALAGQTKAAEVAAEGPKLDEKVTAILAGQGLSRASATPEQIEAARKQAEKEGTERAVAAASATGLAAELSKRNAPLEPKERANLVDADALEKSLDLVQPAAGTTMTQAAGNPRVVSITDKQKDRVVGLRRSYALIDSLSALADQSISATTPSEALVQRGTAETGAIFKTNPAAAAYRDARGALVGNFVRELGGDRGTLSDGDIQRMANGLPNFGDTVTTRNLKMGILREILDASRRGVVGEITGKSASEHRNKVSELLNKLDKVDSAVGKMKVTPVK